MSLYLGHAFIFIFGSMLLTFGNANHLFLKKI